MYASSAIFIYLLSAKSIKVVFLFEWSFSELLFRAIKDGWSWVKVLFTYIFLKGLCYLVISLLSFSESIGMIFFISQELQNFNIPDRWRFFYKWSVINCSFLVIHHVLVCIWLIYAVSIAFTNTKRHKLLDFYLINKKRVECLLYTLKINLFLLFSFFELLHINYGICSRSWAFLDLVSLLKVT